MRVTANAVILRRHLRDLGLRIDDMGQDVGRRLEKGQQGQETLLDKLERVQNQIDGLLQLKTQEVALAERMLRVQCAGKKVGSPRSSRGAHE